MDDAYDHAAFYATRRRGRAPPRSAMSSEMQFGAVASRLESHEPDARYFAVSGRAPGAPRASRFGSRVELEKVLYG